MDAKLGATLRATKCSAETYKKAIAHKRSRSYHEAICVDPQEPYVKWRGLRSFTRTVLLQTKRPLRRALLRSYVVGGGPEKELQTVVPTLPPRQVERHDDDALPGFSEGLGGAVRRREAAEI